MARILRILKSTFAKDEREKRRRLDFRKFLKSCTAGHILKKRRLIKHIVKSGIHFHAISQWQTKEYIIYKFLHIFWDTNTFTNLYLLH